MALLVGINTTLAESWVLDPQFHPVLGDDFAEVTDIKFQSDNRILISGEFISVNGIEAHNLARLNPDGSTDVAFTAKQNFDGYCNSIVLDAVGRIFVSGLYSNVAGIKRPGFARLLSDGSVDVSFVPDLQTGDVEGALVQPDGRILVFGLFKEPPGTDRTSVPVVRLNNDGTRDSTFLFTKLYGGNLYTRITGWNLGTALQKDGRILMIGAFSSINDPTPLWAIRLNNDGSFDNTFQTPPGSADSSFFRDLRLLPDDRYITLTSISIRRWGVNGESEATPLVGGPTAFNVINVMNDGSLLQANSTQITKYSANGAAEWSSALNFFQTFAVAATPDRNLFVAGNTIGGAFLSRFIAPKLTYVNWRDTNFPNATANGPFDSCKNDGIPNFVRYAFGLLPTDDWISPLEIGSDGSVSIHFAAEAPDVSLHLRRALDIAAPNWTEIGTRAANANTWSTSASDVQFKLQTPTDLIITAQTESTSFFTVAVEPLLSIGQ